VSDATVLPEERARRKTLDRPTCGVNAVMRRRPDFDFNHCPNGSAIRCKGLQNATDRVVDFSLNRVLVLLIANDWEKVRPESEIHRPRFVSGRSVQSVDGKLLDLTVRILRVKLTLNERGRAAGNQRKRPTDSPERAKRKETGIFRDVAL
jgi:hypothetical protein